MNDQNGLPRGWTLATVQAVSEVNPLKEHPQLAPETLVSFVPMPAIKEEFGGADVSGVRPLEEVRKGYTQFQQGDILFAKITPCMENGKLAIVPPLVNGWGFGSTEYHVLRVCQEIETKWVVHFLSQEGFRREAQRHMTGSAGQLRVPASWLQQQTIPVAPTNEQRRIVQKIEELFSKLDAGVAALERVKAALKRYRAAVLKAAVEGKLTAEWRAHHPSKETGAQLLRRILDERRRKWEQEQRAKYAKAGRQPPKGWQAKYKEPMGPDTSELPALPEGWCWATVDQLIGFLRNGLSQKPLNNPPGHPILRINAVRPMKVDLEEVRYLNPLPKDAAGYLIEDGDLLFTRYNGSLDLLGVAGLVRSCSRPILHPDKLIRAKTVLEEPLPAYLELACNTGISRKHMARRARTTAGQTGISGSDIREMPVPMPPLTEQQAIVEKVDRRLSVVDEIETQIDASLKRASRLRQSILKRAFEGRLVPQDPHDEPAEKLLARIRAERLNGKEKNNRRASARGRCGNVYRIKEES
jgi:type I restriction enzyme S subunit